MRPMKTINDLIPSMKTGSGIFSAITAPVWAEVFPDASQLDIYFAANYGRKHPTYYLEAFTNAQGIVTGEDLSDLANAIYTMREKEWEQLFKILTADYDPMENTQVTESVAETRSGSGSDGNTRTLNTTTTTGNTRTLNTRTDVADAGNATTDSTSSTNISENTTNSGTNDETVFGFDSSTAVGKGGLTTSDSQAVQRVESVASRSTASSTSSSYSTDTGTVGDSGSTADTGTITDAGSNSFTETFTRAYSKHGNIGVMSNVALFSESVDFYRWDFIRQVCEDICQYIAIAVY